MNRTIITAAAVLALIPVCLAVAVVAPGLWFMVPAAALTVAAIVHDRIARARFRRELDRMIRTQP